MVSTEHHEGDDANGREASLGKNPAGLAARLETVRKILDAASQRDIKADARDQVSVERDSAADLEAFTAVDPGSGYGADLPARRHAAQDRFDAKGDRRSAAADRAALSEIGDGVEDTHAHADGPDEPHDQPS